MAGQPNVELLEPGFQPLLLRDKILTPTVLPNKAQGCRAIRFPRDYPGSTFERGSTLKAVAEIRPIRRRDLPLSCSCSCSLILISITTPPFSPLPSVKPFPFASLRLCVKPVLLRSPIDTPLSR